MRHQLRKLLYAHVAAAGLVAASAGPMGAEQVVWSNSFAAADSPSARTHLGRTTSVGYTQVGAGDRFANDAWQVDQGNIDWVTSYWQGHDSELGDSRNGAVDLNGYESDARIFADLGKLTPGQIYQVSFWLSGNPDGNVDPAISSTKTGDSYVTGQNGGDRWGEISFSFDSSVNTPYSRQFGSKLDHYTWQFVVFSFVAGSTEARLYVESTTRTQNQGLQTSYGPVVDDFRVITAAASPVAFFTAPKASLNLAMPENVLDAVADQVFDSAVPEPDDFLLLGSALALFGLARLSRKG